MGELIKGSFLGSKLYPGMVFKYCVYIPKQLDREKPARLYVSHDEWNAKFTEAMDLIIGKGEMPPTIGIFIEPLTNLQTATLSGSASSCSSRCHESVNVNENHLRLILEEILPFVAMKHVLNISKDASEHYIEGCSSSNIWELNETWHRPDVYRAIYSSADRFVTIKDGNDLSPVRFRECILKLLDMTGYAKRY